MFYSSVARRVADRLFDRLRRNVQPKRKGAIHVRITWCGTHWIVALIIPSTDADFRTFVETAWAHMTGYHYPSTVINTNQGSCLMLAFRVWKRCEEDLDGEEWARKAAKWAEGLFEMRSVPSPMKGPALARWVLRATQTPRFGT